MISSTLSVDATLFKENKNMKKTILSENQIFILQSKFLSIASATRDLVRSPEINLE
jgi:hypothetical protein